jgi:hypothetical protein
LIVLGLPRSRADRGTDQATYSPFLLLNLTVQPFCAHWTEVHNIGSNNTGTRTCASGGTVSSRAIGEGAGKRSLGAIRWSRRSAAPFDYERCRAASVARDVCGAEFIGLRPDSGC